MPIWSVLRRMKRIPKMDSSMASCSVSDTTSNASVDNVATSTVRIAERLVSRYFSDAVTTSQLLVANDGTSQTISTAAKVLAIEKNLSDQLNKLTFGPPVAHVYNPLTYAWETHSIFVSKYGNTKKKILFVGMNPGPWGMMQTGVPFGAINMVQDWLGIAGRVGQPDIEHPRRRVKGFECPRVEVSGQRLWGFFRDLCTTPDNLFKNCFVYSYCPLSFMQNSGRNVTPPELKSSDRKAVTELCDAALGEVMSVLDVNIAVGIGKFAESRIREVVKQISAQNVTIGCMLHPSPINPAANKGWNEAALKCLQDLKILHIVKGAS